MAICPLLKEECIEDECAWWQGDRLEEFTGCSIALLQQRILDTQNSIESLHNLNSKGLHSIYKLLNDINNRGKK